MISRSGLLRLYALTTANLGISIWSHLGLEARSGSESIRMPSPTRYVATVRKA
jgi:hypothetical protein